MFNPLKRISDALESTFGRLCFLIEGVPPQSNYPSAAVPVKVRIAVEKEQCHTFAYPAPEKAGVAAPAYALHLQPRANNRL